METIPIDAGQVKSEATDRKFPSIPSRHVVEPELDRPRTVETDQARLPKSRVAEHSLVEIAHPGSTVPRRLDVFDAIASVEGAG
jgi:hypothetical protein